MCFFTEKRMLVLILFMFIIRYMERYGRAPMTARTSDGEILWKMRLSGLILTDFR